MKYFLPALVYGAFVQCVIFPAWYNTLGFIAALAAFCYGQIHNQEQPKLDDAELNKMKSAVESLANQLNQVSNKVSGIRMHIGLRDK